MPTAGVKPGPSAQQSRALSITPLLPPGRTSGYEETNNAVGAQAILAMVLKCGTEKGLTTSSLRLGPPRVNGALKQGSQVYTGSFATQ